MSENIDFVITWVDSEDPKWQNDFFKYKSSAPANNEMSGAIRYRDLGLLKYTFRGIEKFAPWVRKIHFVTYGHIPEWLNLKHPKINIVNHEDIFPDPSVLPTFNSCPIEMCLHRIPGLAEKFVYFNDDMFILNSIEPKRFFYKHLPNDYLIFYMLFNDGRFSHMLHTIMGIINSEVKNKNKFIRKHFFKIFNLKYGIKYLMVNIVLAIVPQFSLLKIYHHPQPLLKSNFIEVEENYLEDLDRVRSNRYRDFSDLNQYLFRFWSLIKGKFNPYLPKDALYVGINNASDVTKAVSFLEKNSKMNFVCFNEEPGLEDHEFDIFKGELVSFFKKRLKKKSLFEI